MKIFYSILIFLIISGISAAQSSVIEYPFDSITFVSSANIKATTDGGFITIMSVRKSNNQYGVLVSKFDSIGQKTWSKLLTQNIYFVCDVLEMNGGYYITGQSGECHIQLIRLNGNGQFMWKKLYCHPVAPNSSGGCHYGFSLHKLNNSSLIIYGVYEVPNNGSPLITLNKVDSAGTLIWTKQYDYTYTYGRAISLNDNSVLWATGSNLTTIDTLGNLKWSKQISGGVTYGSVATSTANGVAFCTYASSNNSVFKLDNSGNLLWTSNTFKMKPNSITEANNKLIVCGINSEDTAKISLAQLDQSGNVERQLFFNTDSTLLSVKITRLMNNRFVVLAMSPDHYRILYFRDIEFPACGHEDAIITPLSNPISINNTGVSSASINFYTIPGSIISSDFIQPSRKICSEPFPSLTRISEPVDIKSFSLYPNPFSTEATIHITTGDNKGIMRIYNILGEQVRTRKFNESTFIIDRSGLESGMYFFEIHNEHPIGTGKIIIR